MDNKNDQNICNGSPYLISGRERRKLKKELSELKSFVKDFWHWEDVDRAYGGGLDDDTCRKMIADANCKIADMEHQLSLNRIAEDRNEKLEDILGE